MEALVPSREGFPSAAGPHGGGSICGVASGTLVSRFEKAAATGHRQGLGGIYIGEAETERARLWRKHFERDLIETESFGRSTQAADRGHRSVSSSPSRAWTEERYHAHPVSDDGKGFVELGRRGKGAVEALIEGLDKEFERSREPQRHWGETALHGWPGLRDKAADPRGVGAVRAAGGRSRRVKDISALNSRFGLSSSCNTASPLRRTRTSPARAVDLDDGATASQEDPSAERKEKEFNAGKGEPHLWIREPNEGSITNAAVSSGQKPISAIRLLKLVESGIYNRRGKEIFYRRVDVSPAEKSRSLAKILPDVMHEAAITLQQQIAPLPSKAEETAKQQAKVTVIEEEPMQFGRSVATTGSFADLQNLRRNFGTCDMVVWLVPPVGEDGATSYFVEGREKKEESEEEDAEEERIGGRRRSRGRRSRTKKREGRRGEDDEEEEDRRGGGDDDDADAESRESLAAAVEREDSETRRLHKYIAAAYPRPIRNRSSTSAFFTTSSSTTTTTTSTPFTSEPLKIYKIPVHAALLRISSPVWLNAIANLEEKRRMRQRNLAPTERDAILNYEIPTQFPEAVRFILHSIYGRRCVAEERDPFLLIQIYKEAWRWKMERMCAEVSRQLARPMNINFFANLAHAAECMRERGLLHDCIRLYYLQLGPEGLCLLLKEDNVQLDEMQIFLCASAWLNDRSIYFTDDDDSIMGEETVTEDLFQKKKRDQHFYYNKHHEDYGAEREDDEDHDDDDDDDDKEEEKKDFYFYTRKRKGKNEQEENNDDDGDGKQYYKRHKRNQTKQGKKGEGGGKQTRQNEQQQRRLNNLWGWDEEEERKKGDPSRLARKQLTKELKLSFKKTQSRLSLHRTDALALKIFGCIRYDSMSAKEIGACREPALEPLLLDACLRKFSHVEWFPRVFPWTDNAKFTTHKDGGLYPVAVERTEKGRGSRLNPLLSPKSTSAIYGTSSSPYIPLDSSSSSHEPTRTGGGWAWTLGNGRLVNEAVWASEIRRTARGAFHFGVAVEDRMTRTKTACYFDCDASGFVTGTITGDPQVVAYRTLQNKSNVTWRRRLYRGDVVLTRLSVVPDALHITLEVLHGENLRASYSLPLRTPMVVSAFLRLSTCRSYVQHLRCKLLPQLESYILLSEMVARLRKTLNAAESVFDVYPGNVLRRPFLAVWPFLEACDEGDAVGVPDIHTTTLQLM